MFAWVGTILEGRMQEDVADANARLIEQRAEMQAQSIEAERERLTDAQRKIKATQRMSVASRGGLMGGTDLLTLAQEAKEMQMDQLEMVRQRDIARITGANQAAMQRWQGEQAKRASRWTAGMQLGGDIMQTAGMFI